MIGYPRLKKPLATFSSLLVLCVFGCERPTKVRLAGANPPVFLLSGSGKLGTLRIYGPKQRDVGSDKNFAIWEIKPIEGYINGEPVESLREITYGIVPKGYKQIYPEGGLPAPGLVAGERYQYWFQTINAPHARGYFEIVDGKPVAVF